MVRFAGSLFGIGMLFGGSQALATPTEVSRLTQTAAINLGSTDFSSASAVYGNTIDFDSAAGSITNNVNLEPLATNIQFGGLGGTTVSQSSAPDFTTLVPLTTTSPGGSGQGWTFGYDVAASTVPGQSFLTRSVVGGVNELTVSGGGSNFVANGGTFTSTVTLSGDWSNPLSHSAATFGAGYSVLQNFAFSGGVTTFEVQTTNYNGTNPTIDFTLFGSSVATVPEPATLALLGAGAACLGLVRRRRPRG